MTERITIAACWDGGEFYTADHVNRLYRSCLWRCSIPFDFVLFVGPLAERPGRLEKLEKDIRAVPTGFPSWWCGMPLWQADPPGIETDVILYLDLDQVIVGKLDDLALYPSDFVSMKGYPSHNCPRGREREACVSTVKFRRGAGVRIWEEYERAGKPTWDALSGPRGALPMSTEGIVNDPKMGIRYDLFPEEWVASYKLQVMKRGFPEDCRIVAFHGRPKQWEVQAPWIEENWR